MESAEQQSRMQEFMTQEVDWQFSPGECNFLLQLLATLVQENPAIVVTGDGGKEALNYQSIRTIVLLNEKLGAQLRQHAQKASVAFPGITDPKEIIQ